MEHEAPELAGSDRRHLRRLAHELEPVVHVGAAGVTESVIAALDRALRDHELVKLRIARERDNPLCSLLPMLFERVYRDELTRWELYEDMPTYDTSNTNAALAGSGVRFAAMDRTLIARYLRYWIATGQLPPVREGGRGSSHLLAGR